MDTPEKLNTVKTFVQANFIGILAALLIFSSIANIIFYRKLSSIKDNPQQVVQEQTEKLIKRVSKLINLPSGEQPTIATVSDPELLKDQPFFAKAEKGFKVLIYANSGKSILYDPFENKVVEVASINIGGQSTPAPTPTPSPTPKKK
ncbi:MAG: hypothetical protein Q8R55_01135 [Candidatus Taylorbacteria bacterium]|nr:hypothetical protein [Candidatus Taylorbacteria bacterium]